MRSGYMRSSVFLILGTVPFKSSIFTDNCHVLLLIIYVEKYILSNIYPCYMLLP